MKVAVAYHFPFDLDGHYWKFGERFDVFYNDFKPEIEHEVFLVSGNVREHNGRADPIPVVDWTCAIEYHGKGCDIGAYLSAAKGLCGFDLVLFCGATTYFHRAGWLERLVEAREKHGPGFYGVSGSFEASPLGTNPAPNPHVRTSCFACDPKLLVDYPKNIETREDCYRFENGEWRFSRYVPLTKIVYWNSIVDLNDCRSYSNVFRKGDQSNLLIFDRRTDEYQQANPAEKKRLERLADGDIAKFPV